MDFTITQYEKQRKNQMTVEQLIKTLKNAPDQQANVYGVDDDGDYRDEIARVAVDAQGDVLLIDVGKYLEIDEILKEN